MHPSNTYPIRFPKVGNTVWGNLYLLETKGKISVVTKYKNSQDSGADSGTVYSERTLIRELFIIFLGICLSQYYSFILGKLALL